jgi:hypothetical protein
MISGLPFRALLSCFAGYVGGNQKGNVENEGRASDEKRAKPSLRFSFAELIIRVQITAGAIIPIIARLGPQTKPRAIFPYS